MDIAPIITIDVGGRIFRMEAKTALRISLLRAMICPESSPEAYATTDGLSTGISDEELAKLSIIIPKEVPFIDRCPDLFAKLLQSARHGIAAKVPVELHKYRIAVMEYDWWGYPWTVSGKPGELVIMSSDNHICNIAAIRFPEAGEMIAKGMRPDQIVIRKNDEPNWKTDNRLWPIPCDKIAIKLGTGHTIITTVAAALRIRHIRHGICDHLSDRLKDGIYGPVNRCAVKYSPKEYLSDADLSKAIVCKREVEYWPPNHRSIKMLLEIIAYAEAEAEVKCTEFRSYKGARQYRKILEQFGYAYSASGLEQHLACFDDVTATWRQVLNEKSPSARSQKRRYKRRVDQKIKHE